MSSDLALEQMRADWEAVARYNVVRHERDKASVVLHTDKTLTEAEELVRVESRKLADEPGYRSYVMSRPLILMELQEPQRTRQRYIELRDGRQATPSQLQQAKAATKPMTQQRALARITKVLGARACITDDIRESSDAHRRVLAAGARGGAVKRPIDTDKLGDLLNVIVAAVFIFLYAIGVRP